MRLVLFRLRSDPSTNVTLTATQDMVETTLLDSEQLKNRTILLELLAAPLYLRVEVRPRMAHVLGPSVYETCRDYVSI
jgi:uncharacterized membrane protein